MRKVIPTSNSVIDPAFAIIANHRQALITRMPISEMRSNMSSGDPEVDAVDEALDAAYSVERAATVKLRKTIPQALAGITALITYYVEHKDRHFDWIGGAVKSKPGTIAFPDDISFEDSVLRNLAAAMVQISGPFNPER